MNKQKRWIFLHLLSLFFLLFFWREIFFYNFFRLFSSLSFLFIGNWYHQVLRILAWDTLNHLVYYLGTHDKKPGQQHLYVVKDPINEDPRKWVKIFLYLKIKIFRFQINYKKFSYSIFFIFFINKISIKHSLHIKINSQMRAAVSCIFHNINQQQKYTKTFFFLHFLNFSWNLFHFSSHTISKKKVQTK